MNESVDLLILEKDVSYKYNYDEVKLQQFGIFSILESVWPPDLYF